MKKRYYVIFLFLMFAFTIKAQTTQIDGIWESTSGNQFQVERINGGFLYKNLANNIVIQTYYVGENYGIPWYRADFTDGSFQLYMIISSNEISTSNSYNPNQLNTWTKIRSAKTNQNNTNYNQYNGNSQSGSGSGKICEVCKGTGYSNAVIWAPNYTGEAVDDEWCEICKEYRRPHTHKPCYSCGGTGSK